MNESDQPVTPVHERRRQLTPFVTEARWFGGKGRDAVLHAVHRLGRIGEGTEPVVVVDMVEVRYGDDAGPASELYQVPLALYPEPVHRLDHAFVGWWEDPELGWVHAYDAVHDREAMAAWLIAFHDDVRSSGLDFHAVRGHELDMTTHSTLFSGEQSNSSVMFGEDALLKVFRKVTPGRNPDIAVHEVLTRAGSEHVAALYGWLEVPVGPALHEITGPGTGEGVLQLAMLQEFLRTAADGWDLAQTSVRDLYGEADLHAEEAGGDFASESARLGTALADVHRTMAAEFPVAERSREELATLAGQMRARLDEAVRVVPGLAEHADGIRAVYDDVAYHPGDIAQRIHGDLHLGQTLRTVHGWKIVDFEGEPAKPLAERVLPDSRWRDVAGMLRSFDYATRVVAATVAAGELPDSDAAAQREVRAGEWLDRNTDAFLAAYTEGEEITDADRALLSAYTLDKAVYETLYETRNRPAWVEFPLAAIARELSTGGAR